MKSICTQGYFLVPKSADLISDSDIVIGGICHLKNAISPNSGRPLLQMASITIKDQISKCIDWKFSSIHLLYSWTCAICEVSFSYKQSEAEIEIIDYLEGDSYTDFPYEGYPIYFPEVPVQLVPLSNDEQMIIEKLNSDEFYNRFDMVIKYQELSIPKHQIGGQPYLLAGEILSSRCPACNEKMNFFATIGNDTYSDPRGFTDNDFVQLVYEVCSNCAIITVNNYAD